MKFLMKVLFAGAAVCVCIASAKFLFSHKLPNSNRGIYGAREMRNIGSLFVGSSMFRKGINMEIVEKFLGENSYVLAYNGNKPSGILVELEALLSGGVKIENLYVDMYVFSLFSSSSFVDSRLLWDLPPRESLKLFNSIIGRRPDKLAFAYSYFVSSNMRYLFTYPISNALITPRYRKGATTSASTAAGMDQKEADALDLDYLENAPENPDPQQVEAIRDIIRLAADKNINLVFVDTIKYARVYRSRKYADMISKYENLLKSAGADFIRLEDGVFEGDCRNFSDGIHLSGKGQRKFTEKLCAEILCRKAH